MYQGYGEDNGMSWIDEIIENHNIEQASKIDFDNLVIDTPEKESGMLRLLDDIFKEGNE